MGSTPEAAKGSDLMHAAIRKVKATSMVAPVRWCRLADPLEPYAHKVPVAVQLVAYMRLPNEV